MTFPRIFLATLLILSTIVFSIAQKNATESETEKTEAKELLDKKALKMVEQTVGEASALKLWQNRALIFAMAGDLIWKSNQKRAKALFRNSADELIQGAIEPKKDTNDFGFNNYWLQNSPRKVILLMIASHDADLALQMLQETRPVELQRAIDSKDAPKIKGQKKTAVQVEKERKHKYQISQELQLEQQFAVKAAEQDPTKAAKLIRESLEKGVSNSAISLVKKVNKKDEELGKQLLGEIIDKLLSTKFDGFRTTELQVSTQLLEQSANAKSRKAKDPKFEPLKIEEPDLKRIANKIVDYYLSTTSDDMVWGFSSILPILKKYAPEREAVLKQKEKKIRETSSESMQSYQDAISKINDPNMTAEELLTDAKNYSTWQKRQFYRKAVDKFIEQGKSDKARQLLNAETESKQKTDALNYLTTRLSQSAIKNGKLEEAEELIDQAETAAYKITIMVELAIGFEKKNTEESHKIALEIIEEASGLVNDVPESLEEANSILKISSGFAYIKPKRSYDYLTSLIYMSNDLLTARALIAKYNKRNLSFKKGEIVLTQMFDPKYVNYGEALGKLAEDDLGKAESLVGLFQKQELQMFCKLIIAQSILKGKIGLEGNSVNNVIFYS